MNYFPELFAGESAKCDSAAGGGGWLERIRNAGCSKKDNGKNRAVSKEKTLFCLNKSQSALGELGRAAGGLEAVLLKVLGSKILGLTVIRN